MAASPPVANGIQKRPREDEVLVPVSEDATKRMELLTRRKNMILLKPRLRRTQMPSHILGMAHLHLKNGWNWRSDAQEEERHETNDLSSLASPNPDAGMSEYSVVARDKRHRHYQHNEWQQQKEGGISRWEELRELAGGSDAIPQGIIIVPSNKTALVNLLNVEEFLINGVFEELDREALQSWPSRAPQISIRRNINNCPMEFRVLDHPTKLQLEDWKKVVAVIVDGNEWQFRGWPYLKIVDLFFGVCGFYVNFKGKPPSTHVSGWNVKTLELQKFQRHDDVKAKEVFWNTLQYSLNCRTKALQSLAPQGRGKL